jgi:hypothetical protein
VGLKLRTFGISGQIRRSLNCPFVLVRPSVPLTNLTNDTSPSSDAPARLKKELDVVLTLQADLDASEKALQVTRTVVEKGTNTDETLDALESLERSHDRLMNKVEVLYASLNVQDRFPELQGVDLDFVRTLLMARDLKINIRKRAIGSFFEWDKLDRAVGGANQALGKYNSSILMQRMTQISKARSYINRHVRLLRSVSLP